MLRVTQEIGLDLSDASPQPVDRPMVEEADVVITQGCGEECPLVPGKRYSDWPLPDPAELSLGEDAPVRNRIDQLVGELLRELAPDHPRD